MRSREKCVLLAIHAGAVTVLDIVSMTGFYLWTVHVTLDRLEAGGLTVSRLVETNKPARLGCRERWSHLTVPGQDWIAQARTHV